MNDRMLIVACACLAALLGSARANAATLTVCPTGCTFVDLQLAIDAAAYGDRILLRAGTTYTGHFVLRAKAGSGSIEIRSDAPDSSFPGADRRLVPDDRGGATRRSALPRLVGRGGPYITVPLLRTEPGAHGYRIRFLEFDGVSHAGYETLILLGDDTTAAAPYDITLDRVYVHGDRHRGQKRGIALNGRQLAVLNSYVADIKAANADAQAIAGWNGAGPFTIENNYLEASGENILFGGADPAVSGLVPSDIVVRRNHLFKPAAWRNAILSTPGGFQAATAGTGALPPVAHYFRVVAVMATASASALSAPSAEVSAVAASGAVSLAWNAVPGADKYRVYRGGAPGAQAVYTETTAASILYTGTGETVGAPSAGGTKWVVKNTFELKNAARVIVDGNIVENCWAAGQAGYAIMLTPRNSGRAPWSRVQDVTFTNNVMRHVAGVVNIAGYDNTAPTERTERITFRNNVFEDVNHDAYGSGARPILVGAGVADAVFDRNTIIHTSSSVVFAYGAAMPGFVYTNNISQHHAYGITGQGSSSGTPTLTAFFPGAVVRCNVLAGGNAALYPAPNGFPTVAQFTASFVDPANGNYTVRAGSPVALAGCNGAVPGANIAEVNAASAAGAFVRPPQNLRQIK